MGSSPGPKFEQEAGPYPFTEGPVWDGSRLIFTDIPARRIMAFQPETGRTTELITDSQKANGLALDGDGRRYGCQDSGRRVVRFEADGSRTVVAESFQGRRLNSPNDLTIDRDGRIWFSDPRYGPMRDDMELDHVSVYLATLRWTGRQGPLRHRRQRGAVANVGSARRRWAGTMGHRRFLIDRTSDLEAP